MTDYAEKPECPVAALWRACALLEAAGTVPLQATDAVSLLTYRARLALRHQGCKISAPGANEPGHAWQHHVACEGGPGAAAMLQLLALGHTVR